jgi:hypothetical protein
MSRRDGIGQGQVVGGMVIYASPAANLEAEIAD